MHAMYGLRTQLKRLASTLARRTGALGLLLLSAVAVQAAPFAYIPNANSNNVSVIDIATNAVVATVPVGLFPRGSAVNPGGAFAYIANSTGNSVSVINTATNTVATTRLGLAPWVSQ